MLLTVVRVVYNWAKDFRFTPPPGFTLTHFFQQSGSLKALLITQLQHLNCYQVNIKKIAYGIVNSIMTRLGQRKIKSHYQCQFWSRLSHVCVFFFAWNMHYRQAYLLINYRLSILKRLHFKNEAKWKTFEFYLTMCKNYKLLVFKAKISHLPSFWKRGFGRLEITYLGLTSNDYYKFNILRV